MRDCLNTVPHFYFPYRYLLLYKNNNFNNNITDMKYLKKFSTTAEYNAYTADTANFILPNVSLCEDTKGVYYNPEHDYSKDYFTMVVTVGGDIKWSGSTIENTLSYSKDNGDNWSAATSADTISVEAGDKVLWKGTPTPQLNKGIGKFSGATDVRYSVEGNAMSLLFGDDFKTQTSLEDKDYALYKLFSGSTNVTSAENLSLPATTLAERCYLYMFQGCTSLTTAPELPATTLASGCYNQMFYNCTSLTTAPELPATTLANYCYQFMFSGCRSLSSIKCLATNISANGCTSNWVNGVASSGTFTKAASMSSWTTGTSGIPNGWGVQDAA